MLKKVTKDIRIKHFNVSFNNRDTSPDLHEHEVQIMTLEYRSHITIVLIE